MPDEVVDRAFVEIIPVLKDWGRKVTAQISEGLKPVERLVKQRADSLDKTVASSVQTAMAGEQIRKLSEQLNTANRDVARSTNDVKLAELDLQVARKRLADVTNDVNATEEDRTRALVGVSNAEIKHGAAIDRVAAAQRNAVTIQERITRSSHQDQVQTEKTVASHDRLRRTLNNPVDVRQFQTLAQKIRDLQTIISATLKPIQQMSLQIGKFAVLAGAGSAALVGGTGLVAQVLALAGALAQAAQATPVVATGLLGLLAVIGTVKASMVGVGEAIKNVVKDQLALATGAKQSKASLAKLNDSLNALAPNARKFVVEFARIFPELHKVQGAIQQRFFAGFATDLRNLAARYLPDVNDQATKLATVLNQTLRGAVAGLLTSTTQWNFTSVLAEARRSLERFSPILAAIPNLFIQIASAAAPAFAGITTDLARVLSGVVDHIRGSIASGDLTAGIKTGIGVIKQLGDIVSNIFSGIAGTIKAASAAAGSGGLLGQLTKITGAFANFAKSAAGQNTLRGIFAAALPVLRTFGDVLRLLGPQLAQLAPVVLKLAGAFLEALKPVIPIAGALAKSLGGVLIQILPAVSKLAVAFGTSLMSAIKVLGPVIPPLVDAVTSLLSPFGVVHQLIVTIAPVLVPLAKGLGQVVGILAGGLITVLKAIQPVLPTIVQGIVALATALATGLAAALTAIAPSLPALGKALGELATVLSVALAQALQAIVPVLPQLVSLLIQWLNAIIPLIPAILPLIPPLVQLALTLLPLFQVAITKVIPLMIQMTTVFVKVAVPVLAFATAILGPVAQAMAFAIGIFVKVAGAVLTFATKVGAFLANVAVLFAGAPGKWAGALASLPGKLGSFFTGVFSFVGRKIGQLIEGLKSFFSAIPGKVAGWIGDLSGVLVHAGLQLIGGFVSGIVRGWENVKTTLTHFTSTLAGLKGPPERDRRILRPSGRWVIEGFVRGLNDRRRLVTNVLSNFTDNIPVAFDVSASARGGAAGDVTGASSGITFAAGSIVVNAAGGMNVSDLATQVRREIASLLDAQGRRAAMGVRR